LLPTLTVTGNNNRKGLTAKSGDGLATVLRRIPTLTAADSLSGADSRKRGASGMGNLLMAIKRLPTLAARDHRSPNSAESQARRNKGASSYRTKLVGR
jgi:hypothetical protein